MATPDRVVRAAVPPGADPSGAPGAPRGGDGEAATLLARGPGVTAADRVAHHRPVVPDRWPRPPGPGARGDSPGADGRRTVSRALARAGVLGGRLARGRGSGAGRPHGRGWSCAVFAPLPELAAVVVLDEHDEGLQNESSPTWHAREVAIERARRAGVPLPAGVAVSLAGGPGSRRPGAPEVVPAGRRRAGWSPVRWSWTAGTTTPAPACSPRAFVEAARTARGHGRPVVCVLNRTGRARLLACRSCWRRSPSATRCGAAVQTSPGGRPSLACGRCGSRCGPWSASYCGSRPEAAARRGDPGPGGARGPPGRSRWPVGAPERGPPPDPAGVVIGTEAVLHRPGRLPAGPVGPGGLPGHGPGAARPRYRAAEEAMALLVGAWALVGRPGGPAGGVVSWCRPASPATRCWRPHCVPTRTLLAAAERCRREMLGLPPAALGRCGRWGGGRGVDRAARPARGGRGEGPRDGWWLVRADDPATLADACASVQWPSAGKAPAQGRSGPPSVTAPRLRYPAPHDR